MKKIDKRTKAYKESQKKSEGLGDTVEKVIEKVLPKKAVEWLKGKDCGCDKRKQFLNEKYRYKANCLVQSEYDWLTEYFKRHNKKKFPKYDVFNISQMHARVFQVRTKICHNCNGAITVLNQMVEQLKNVHEAYK